MSDAARRTLMRSIWAKNLERRKNRKDSWWDIGFERKFEKPWLIENFVEHHPTERDLYDRQKIVEMRVEFSDDPRREVPRWEHFQRFRQSIEYLYWEAERARDFADSHRTFNVGAAIFAYKPNRQREHSWEVHLGMNTKVQPNSRPVCAEPIALSSAKVHGCSLAVGMVIVGELREEDEGVTKTLHPCHECRIIMNSERSIVRPDTLIVTALPPNEDGTPGDYEIRTFKELLLLHEHIHGHAH